MFAADSQPHVIKGDLLDIDFTMDMDHRKRRRNRTTQSCLNCHTSKRKCDRKRPCQRCIQLGLTGLCVYEVDDPALRDDPDLDETTRLRNRIAELESLVRELRGKPHPRWADPNYCDGDVSDKWHTRSQRRGNAAAALAKQRRQQSPHTTAPLIKTEPIADMQHSNCYYRLSPSPPPSATSTTYSMNIAPTQTNTYAQNAYEAACANGSNGNTGYTPAAYSPASTSSSGLNGHSPNGMYQYEDACACVSDPAANHSFVALARQLEGMSNYLQHLPGHSQSRCSIYRHIQDLKSILHGDRSPKQTATTSNEHYTSLQGHAAEAVRSPVDNDMITPLAISTSVAMSTPATPHSIHMLQWGAENNAHHNGQVNAYFAGSDVYAKGVGTYDVVS